MTMKMSKKVGMISIVAFLLTSSSIFAQSSIFSNTEHYEVRILSGDREGFMRNGTLETARFNQPHSVVELSNGDLLITDTLNQSIRKITSSEVTSYAGTPIGFNELEVAIGGYYDAQGEQAAFDLPSGLVADDRDTVYVADSANNMIRKITADGTVTTFAGNTAVGHADGTTATARFNLPMDVALDSKGNLYVADTLNHVIRKITPEGKVTTINALSDRVVEYTPGFVEQAGDFADGAFAVAKFNEPTALVVDSNDNLYVADRGNQRIRYIDFTSQTVSTVAGSGQLNDGEHYVASGFKDGLATEAQFNSPEGMTLVGDNILLVADRNNHTIRKIDNGKVSTLVGQPEEYGGENGVLAYATLNEPTDVVLTASNTLLIVEAGYNRIRVVNSYLDYSDDTIENQLQILLNGKLIETDVAPYTVNARTVVPVRALAEAMNMSINYMSDKSIVLETQEKQYIFNLNSNKVTVVTENNEETIILDTGVQLKDNRSFIPVRFVTEQLGYHVAWDAERENVVIRDTLYE